MTRLFVAGLISAALLPASGSAQRSRDFEDSWFWGVKAGVSTFAPTFGDTETSATYGLEWLITRTHGALYISVDEANVYTHSAVFDPTADGSFREVEVDKLRRVGFAALAFPKRFGRFRPYAGLGLTLNVIGDAYPEVEVDEDPVDDAVFQRIDDRRSQSALLGMAGVQMQFHRTAIFAQASLVPASSKFLLNDSALGFFEMGVRYNFGGAREGIR
ncbi:MAG: hypothetical protein ABI681_01240 [Gemmatimonadales bacterium]